MINIEKYINNPKTNINDDLDFEIKKLIIKYDYTFLKYFSNISYELATYAIKINISSFDYINSSLIDKTLLSIMLQSSNSIIKFFNNPRKEHLNKIIEKNPLIIKHLYKTLDIKYIKHILEINPYYIKYVINQTTELIKFVIDLDPMAYKHSTLHTLELDMYLLSKSENCESVKLLTFYPIMYYKQILDYDAYLIMKFNKEDITNEIQYYAINKTPKIIKIIKNSSYKMKEYALSLDGLLLEFMDYDLNLINIALRQNGLALQFIKKKSLQMIVLAIKSQPMCLDFIKKPRKFMIYEALKTTPLAIKYLDKQTFNEALNAVQRDGKSIEFINLALQNEQIQLIAMATSGYDAAIKINQPFNETVILEIIKYNPSYIYKIEEPTSEMYKVLFTVAGGMILNWVDWQSKFSADLINTALSSDGSILEYIDIKNRTLEHINTALETYPLALEWISIQTEEMVLNAVEKDGNALQFVDDKFITTELFDIARKTATFQTETGINIINYTEYLKTRI